MNYSENVHKEWQVCLRIHETNNTGPTCWSPINRCTAATGAPWSIGTSPMAVGAPTVASGAPMSILSTETTLPAWWGGGHACDDRLPGRQSPCRWQWRWRWRRHGGGGAGQWQVQRCVLHVRAHVRARQIHQVTGGRCRRRQQGWCWWRERRQRGRRTVSVVNRRVPVPWNGVPTWREVGWGRPWWWGSRVGGQRFPIAPVEARELPATQTSIVRLVDAYGKIHWQTDVYWHTDGCN